LAIKKCTVFPFSFSMKNLVIIKTGTTHSSILESFGDFEDWIAAGLAHPAISLEVVDAVYERSFPLPAECLGVIVTGSHAMVTENLPWSLRIERWLPSLVEAGTPLLGICYGHQLLGRAMGGEVGYNPLGRELGTVEIGLLPAAAGDPLFSGIPRRFSVHAAHAQSLLRLPPDAELLASGDHDPHHAFRIGNAAWGVQFHPEYSEEIMKADISEGEAAVRSTSVAGEAEVRNTPYAAQVLVNFAEFVSRQRD
jgi:GMP synthase (glutamine-hydrolysing)